MVQKKKVELSTVRLSVRLDKNEDSESRTDGLIAEADALPHLLFTNTNVPCPTSIFLTIKDLGIIHSMQRNVIKYFWCEKKGRLLFCPRFIHKSLIGFLFLFISRGRNAGLASCSFLCENWRKRSPISRLF